MSLKSIHKPSSSQNIFYVVHGTVGEDSIRQEKYRVVLHYSRPFLGEICQN